MPKDESKILINVKVNISVQSIQNVVINMKRLSIIGKDKNAKIDTADKLSEMLSKFLEEKNFELYTNSEKNYLKNN